MTEAVIVASSIGPLLAATTVAGIALGGVFALSALGVALVYRVTGVLNFAQGAVGMFSTFIAWSVLFYLHPLAPTEGQAFKNVPSILIGVAAALLFSMALGLVLHFGVFRWLKGRPQLVKAVITVGVLLALQSIASLRFGSTQYHEAIRFFDPARCPYTNPRCVSLDVPGANFSIGYDQLLVIGVALILAGGLALFLRGARVGIAMRAVSDDIDAASLWGVPVDLVGAVSWMMGSLVAALAAILIISEGGATFDTISLTVLILDALAAALIGGLVSLPLTVAGGFALGLLEEFPKLWISSPGLTKFVAIVVILAALLARSEKSLLRAKA
jgi:sulfate-transporting ATPase